MSRNHLNFMHVFWLLLIEIKHFLQAIWFLLKYLPKSTQFDYYSCRIFEKQFCLLLMVTFHAYQPIFSLRNEYKSIMSRNHPNIMHVFWRLLIEIKHFLQAIWFLLKYLPNSTQFDYYSCRICEKQVCLVLMVTFNAYQPIFS